MRTQEYQNMCQAIGTGKEKFVKHVVTHQIGKVLACHEGEFEVDVAGEHKTWIKENCKEESH
ncbi:hypothetical protein DESUT3_01080 [Desulfuromonas versatilis]|uniref:Uncharacterized protein n=2 Tax=Desulfuromonas versatilis TaxID=2802975 RepID=A0ABM8HRF2_9BACT|nr:hypothetical protein DESUT3_01080 [Desulfuromonas versatilis]